MIRKYGGDRVYRTSYMSGVQWRRDRRRVGLFRRMLLTIKSAVAGFASFIAGLFLAVISSVAGLFSGRTRPGRHAQVPSSTADALDGEPITLRRYMARRRGRLSFFPRERSVVYRFLLITIAAVLLLSVALAVPPVSVFADSSTVMLLDEDEGIAYQISSKASTVGELLDAYDFKLSVGDIVYPDRTQPLRDGQEIHLRRAMSVTTQVDGIARDLRIQAGTVREALAMSGVSYGASDIIAPTLNTQLKPGMTITITRVTEQTITETRRIYYQKMIQKDKSLYIGETVVAQEGREGEREVDVRIVYHDGVEVSRDEVAERILEVPQHLIVKEGTTEKPVAKAAATNKAATTTKTSSSTGSGSPGVSGDWYKSAGYKENTYWVFYGDKQYEKKESMTVRATAYTHTGSKTRSGNWPSVGTIAVDASVIPLGTRIFVPGYGIGIAQDTGSAIKGNKIDVFFNTNEECVRWGNKSVKIYIIGKPQPREL